MENKQENKQELRHKVFTIVGIVFCAILLPLLIVNVVMIINSYTHKDEAPSFGKYVPFIVTSNSMSGVIEGGDIILTKKIDPQNVELYDIIAFYDPKGSGTSVVTHRVIKIDQTENGLVFYTVGDANFKEHFPDREKVEYFENEALENLMDVVPENKVISEYSFRIPLLGHVSLFMSTIPGFIVCVLVPLLLLVGYDVIRRKINDKANKQDTDALLAELEMLRAAKNSVQHDKEEIKEEAIEAPIQTEEQQPEEEQNEPVVEQPVEAEAEVALENQEEKE